MSPFPNGFIGRSIVCNGRDLTVQVRVSDEFASIRYQNSAALSESEISRSLFVNTTPLITACHARRSFLWGSSKSCLRAGCRSAHGAG